MRRTSHKHEDENRAIFDNWQKFLNLFCELSKIDLLIVKDCPILVLVLMTRSPRLILHPASDIGWDVYLK